MLKKNLKLLVALVTLAIIATILILKNSSSTLKKELSDFAIKDTASIDKFFIADKSGNKVLLERKNNFEWTLNGKYKARPDVVNNFLSVICKLQVNAPVAKAAFNNIVKQLATSGIKVEVYSKGQNIKTFYVGGGNQFNTGTYMIIENSTTPFAVTIPGFEGYLTPNFSSHETVWRATTVFDYNYNEISKLDFSFITNPENSFSIEKKNENGINKVALTIANKPIAVFDTAIVNEYLLQFKNLNYEAVSDKVRATRKDSALQMPLFKVDILSVSGEKRTATFYRKPVDKGTLDNAGNPTDYDIERLFTIINGNTNEMIVTQYYVFDKIIKTGPSFLKK